MQTCLLALAFFTGLSLLLYPDFSNYWNSLHQTKEINEYIKETSGITLEEYEEMRKDAAAYNANITARQNPFVLSEDETNRYYELLNIGKNEIMGYIEIPSLALSLPIFHGTSDSVLQKAVGHLEWTSLPVGGESTHCVLSGHRGLPSAKLFTHLDKLADGDLFFINVLNEVLTYEVDQILIVDPKDTKDLQIVQGKDYCTLVTCTPYGINTHRLLVRGHRIDNQTEASVVHITADAVLIEPMIVTPILIVPLLLLLLVAVLIKDKRSSHSAEEEENEI